MQSNLEQGLDSGAIVIVPVPPAQGSYATKWKCVLVDESSRCKMFTRLADKILRWNVSFCFPITCFVLAVFCLLIFCLLVKDVDGKELQFLSENRPAQRYLYFRYIITYLYAKKAGNTDWTERVENCNDFWPTSGPYVEKSTLQSLARNISGCQLPAPLYERATFEEPDKDESQDLLLSSRLRSAIIESSKRSEEEDEEEEEEEEEEEDEED